MDTTAERRNGRIGARKSAAVRPHARHKQLKSPR